MTNTGQHQGHSVLELSDKNFKASIITTLNDIKENTLMMSEKN